MAEGRITEGTVDISRNNTLFATARCDGRLECCDVPRCNQLMLAHGPKPMTSIRPNYYTAFWPFKSADKLDL